MHQLIIPLSFCCASLSRAFATDPVLGSAISVWGPMEPERGTRQLSEHGNLVLLHWREVPLHLSPGTGTAEILETPCPWRKRAAAGATAPGREQLSRSQPRLILCSHGQMAFFLCSDRGRAIETLPVSSTKQVIPPHSHLLGMCGGLVRPSHEVFSFPRRQQDDGTACVG